MMKQRYKSERVTSGPALTLVADPAADNAAPTKAAFVMKTLAELGPNLPVGVLANGARVRPFRVRPFKMKQEKALAILRDESKGATIGRFVCEALAMMLQTVGPHNFDAMKDNERQVAINQLSMPDVLYMYLYLRHSALGDEPVVMQIKCPVCSVEYRWYGDLGSMDVKVVGDDTSSLIRDYALRDSFQVRGKECKNLKLGLIKWDTFCRPEFQNKNSANAEAIKSSIVAIDAIDAPIGTLQLTDTDLDDMSRYDMSGLTDDINSNTPGPQLNVEPICPGCNHHQVMMMDWSWDNFFARSARQNPSMS